MLFLVLAIANFLFVKNIIVSSIFSIVILISCIITGDKKLTLLITKIFCTIQIVLIGIYYIYLIISIGNLISNNGKFQRYLIEKEGFECFKDICKYENTVSLVRIENEFNFNKNIYSNKIFSLNSFGNKILNTNSLEYDWKNDIVKGYSNIVAATCNSVYDFKNDAFSCTCTKNIESLDEYENKECESLNSKSKKFKNKFNSIIKYSPIDKIEPN